MIFFQPTEPMLQGESIMFAQVFYILKTRVLPQRPAEGLTSMRIADRRVEQIAVSRESYFRRYTTVVSVSAGSGVGSP